MVSPTPSSTLILGREDVAKLLGMRDCIDAVERPFLSHAQRQTIPPGVLGAHVDGGGFHMKSAGLLRAVGGRPVFAAKINANFPDNPTRCGLPTIQGVIALFDAIDGRLLALLDSIGITSLRTAAATAVAAKYLAPEGNSVAICGCGGQARNQIRALAAVHSIARVVAIDVQTERAERFAEDLESELGVEVAVSRSPAEVGPDVNIWITCTPAKHWILGRSHVGPGAFIAAVGADSPEKQEIEPELLASNVVIADVLEQSAAMGDLHHAVDARLMRREDVRAELADVVAGSKPGRLSHEEIIIFDSTGTALQDVAAATLAYERARAVGAGAAIDLGGSVAQGTTAGVRTRAPAAS